jgi:hypothetical protein
MTATLTPEQVARNALLNGVETLLTQGDTDLREGRVDEAVAALTRAQHVAEKVKLKDEQSINNNNAVDSRADDLLREAKSRLEALADLKASLPQARRFEAVFTVEGARVFKIELCAANPSASQRALLCRGRFQLLQPSGGNASAADSSDGPIGLSILKLDHFQYPLTGDVPCLAMRPGYYVFPTPTASVFYGLVFPRALPSAYVVAFENICSSQCQLRRLPPEQAAKLPPLPGDEFEPSPAAPAAPATTSTSTSTAVVPASSTAVALATPSPPSTRTSRALTTVSHGVESGSELLVRGVTSTGVWLASSVARSGAALRERLAPAVQPVAVRPEVKATVKAVASVTPHLVFVSKTLVDALLELAFETGAVIGTAVAQRTAHDDKHEPPSAAKAAAMDLGKTTVAAIANVWEALEQAGGVVVSGVGTEAVHTVDHKYGHDAAEVARDATTVTNNLLETVHNVKHVAGKKALKRLGKRAAMKAAKATTVTYFTYDDGEKRTLTIESNKAVLPQLLIEGVAPATEDNADVFLESDEALFLAQPGGTMDATDDEEDDDDDDEEIDGEKPHEFMECNEAPIQ